MTAPAPLVCALGYVGLVSARLEDWRTFGTEVLGLEEVALPYAGAEELRFRIDERDWRIAIEPGERESLGYFGWETRNKSQLDALAERLSARGVPVVEEKPEVAAYRGVAELYSCQDPDGNRLEFYWGQLAANETFRSPTDARFVAGALGVGHVVWRAKHFEECAVFYLDDLGFRLSDTATLGARQATFLHVNERHHSLALLKGDPNAPSVSHLMLEVTTLDMVGRALDRCLDSGRKLRSSLGRHTNDEMVSFYVPSPSGFNLEYGWGGRLLDVETHVAVRYSTDGVWGHRAGEN